MANPSLKVHRDDQIGILGNGEYVYHNRSHHIQSRNPNIPLPK